jgi:histidine triad (HIT) family protein
MASIFTRIIRGEIPCHRIAETESHIAFLDIRPVSRGHTLVVPKVEIDYLFDLDDAAIAETMIFAKRVAGHLDRVLKPIRTAVVVEGLEVPHAHVHLIPIHHHGQETSLRAGAPPQGYTLEEVAEALRAGIGG